MWDYIYPFFGWAEQSWLGHAIRESKWVFAITEVLHLFGLTVLIGTTLLLALRLLGWALQERPARELARELTPWVYTALTTVLTTGILLFVSEAVKCWRNPAFRYKMLFLFLALIFQFTVLKVLSRSDEERFPALTRALTGIVAVVLWFGVAVAGRAIAFF
jgi:hypothetical protein